jgi:hypothetical protein
VTGFLYDLPRELNILPEAALAIARVMNEREPYLPDELLEEPLDEKNVRAIAKKHDVVPRLGGDKPAVLFELFARLTHRNSLHSLEPLVSAWDLNEESALEVVADAIQPLVFEAWERLRAKNSMTIASLVHRYFIAEYSLVIREIYREVAARDLRTAAEYIERSRAQLQRDIDSAKGDAALALDKHKSLWLIERRTLAALVRRALEQPPGSAANVLCTEKNVEALRALRYKSGLHLETIAAHADRFECPELRAAVLRARLNPVVR